MIIEGKNIKDPVDVSSLGIQSNLFHHKQTIRHQDIIKLVDQAIKKYFFILFSEWKWGVALKETGMWSKFLF